MTDEEKDFFKKDVQELEQENEGLSNSVTELTNTKTELENKVTELTKQIEKLKEILSFEEYREQFQKGKRTLLGKTIKEWLIYQNESEELKKQLVRTKEEKDFFKKGVQELEQENAELKERFEKLVNAFNDYECAGPEQEQENTWEILRELMHQEMGV